MEMPRKYLVTITNFLKGSEIGDFFINFLVSFRSTTNLEIQDESYFGGSISWLLKSCWCKLKKHKLSKFQGAQMASKGSNIAW